MFEKVNPMHPDRQEQGVHIHLPGWDRDNHTIMKISSHIRKALPPLSEKRLCISLSLKLCSQDGQSVRTDPF
jgi:hypothetical protein